jgi:hypothetical protein
VRPEKVTREAGAAACELLGLDPASVSSIGFDVEAAGYVRVRVELLVDLDLARRLAGAMLADEREPDTRPDARLPLDSAGANSRAASCARHS